MFYRFVRSCTERNIYTGSNFEVSYDGAVVPKDSCENMKPQCVIFQELVKKTNPKNPTESVRMSVIPLPVLLDQKTVLEKEHYCY